MLIRVQHRMKSNVACLPGHERCLRWCALLDKAIEELEERQAKRKAREESAGSMDAEPAKRPAELNEGQPEKQGENLASSDTRAFEEPEDDVGKDEAA